MSEKLELLHTDRVLIVEGKYDAARLSHLTDAMILLTDGFGIYKDKKRQQLFKQLAHKNGLILLTDSDAAGFRIRTYITNLVGEKNVVQAYVPAIHGKEKRKAQPGKEGLLGVEGVDDALVLQALREKKLALPLQSRRGGKLLIPTSMSGGFRVQRARLSGKQSCSALSACRPGSRKKSWWKPSTAFTATSSWTKCSRNCSKHENTVNSPKKNVKKIQAILLGNLP